MHSVRIQSSRLELQIIRIIPLALQTVYPLVVDKSICGLRVGLLLSNNAYNRGCVQGCRRGLGIKV